MLIQRFFVEYSFSFLILFSLATESLCPSDMIPSLHIFNKRCHQFHFTIASAPFNRFIEKIVFAQSYPESGFRNSLLLLSFTGNPIQTNLSNRSYYDPINNLLNDFLHRHCPMTPTQLVLLLLFGLLLFSLTKLIDGFFFFSRFYYPYYYRYYSYPYFYNRWPYWHMGPGYYFPYSYPLTYYNIGQGGWYGR